MSAQKQKITFSVKPETKALLATVSKNLGKPVSVVVEEWVSEVLKSLSDQIMAEDSNE